MDNTAELPLRVKLYWSSAEGQSRGIPAALVADMYCTNVMAYSIVHSWIEATFITQGRLLDLPLGDIMKLSRYPANMIEKAYRDETGEARAEIYNSKYLGQG